MFITYRVDGVNVGVNVYESRDEALAIGGQAPPSAFNQVVESDGIELSLDETIDRYPPTHIRGFHGDTVWSAKALNLYEALWGYETIGEDGE